MAKKEVCPRDEIADPPGMAVLPIDTYGFGEGLVSFRTLCGVLRKASAARVNRRLLRYYLIVRLLPNVFALACRS